MALSPTLGSYNPSTQAQAASSPTQLAEASGKASQDRLLQGKDTNQKDKGMDMYQSQKGALASGAFKTADDFNKHEAQLLGMTPEQVASLVDSGKKDLTDATKTLNGSGSLDSNARTKG